MAALRQIPLLYATSLGDWCGVSSIIFLLVISQGALYYGEYLTSVFVRLPNDSLSHRTLDTGQICVNCPMFTYIYTLRLLTSPVNETSPPIVYSRAGYGIYKNYIIGEITHAYLSALQCTCPYLISYINRLMPIDAFLHHVGTVR